MATKDALVIRDIDIPFGRMVMILLKLMFAAIPAMILFWLFWMAVGALLALAGWVAAPEIRFLHR